VRDVPYFLSGGRLKAAARRLASMVALLSLDLCGLALGVYTALALREFVTGSRPILWGLIWRDAEAKWLPFLALVTALVFWRNGLYADREHRAGFGRAVSSLVLVTLLALFFCIGTATTSQPTRSSRRRSSSRRCSSGCSAGATTS
jgi:hypothetical protein